MNILKKSGLWLMTGALPVFIAACYGTADFEYEDDGGTTTKSGTVLNSLKEGIKGILVSCLNEMGSVIDETYSMEDDGYYSLVHLETQQCETIRFEDVDGDENGGKFATKEISGNTDNSLDVELELAE